VDFDKRREEHFRDQPRDVVKQDPHAREARERIGAGKDEKGALPG
jgi:hypothetical protein